VRRGAEGGDATVDRFTTRVLHRFPPAPDAAELGPDR
jgi:hypothetical protein